MPDIKPEEHPSSEMISSLQKRVADLEIAETFRQQTEAALRKAAQDYQVIFDSVPALVWFKDLNNRFIKVNQAAAQAMGLAVEAIEGKSAYQLFPEEAEKYYQDDLEVIRSQKPKLGIREEMRISGGKRIWVKTDKLPLFDEQGELIGLLLFVIDIDDTHKTEAKLLESEERYRTAIESSNDGVSIVKEGRHQYVNTKFLEMFGYRDPEEVLGMDLALTVHPDDVEMVRERNRQRERGRSPESQYEFKAIRKDGSPFHVEISTVRIILREEPVILSHFRDISERKQAEAEREKLIVELREAFQKIKTLSGLLPICAGCKKIRNDQGYWQQIESFIGERSEAEFTHGLCPECLEKFYPGS